MLKSAFTLFASCCIAATPLTAQKTKILQPASPAHFADIADLADAASIVAEVKVRSAKKIRMKGQPAGAPVRFLVDATTLALIRGPDGVPARIRYMTEAIPDANGKLPKLAKGVMVLFAQTVDGRPGEVQLVAPDAQLWWSEQLGADVRAILRALADPRAPARVTGVANAFHSAGALPGEGETQIFLSTADASSVSLMVTRVAGAPPRWTVSFGDVVDPDAPPPVRNTIGWYRLACFLPDEIPAGALAEADADQHEAISRDYRFVLDALGTCPRYRKKG